MAENDADGKSPLLVDESILPSPTPSTSLPKLEETTFPVARAYRVLESALPIATLSAASYYIGFVYYTAYLGSLAPISNFPVLSTSEYFIKTFQLSSSTTVYQVLFVLAAAAPLLPMNPTSKYHAFLGNLPFFVMLIIGFLAQWRWNAFTIGFNLTILVFVALYCVYFGIFIMLTIRKNTPLSSWKNGNLGGRIYWCVYATFLLLTFGSSLVQSKARYDIDTFISGDDSPSFSSTFDLRSDHAYIEGRHYRVVLHRGGNYFAVAVNEDEVTDREVVVIPESDVINVVTVKDDP